MIAVSRVKCKTNKKGLREFACCPCAGPRLTSRLHIILVCVQLRPVVETCGCDPLGETPPPVCLTPDTGRVLTEARAEPEDGVWEQEDLKLRPDLQAPPAVGEKGQRYPSWILRRCYGSLLNGGHGQTGR